MNSNLDPQNDMHSLAHVTPAEAAHYVPTAEERAEVAAPAPIVLNFNGLRDGFSRRRVIRGVYDRKGHYHDID